MHVGVTVFLTDQTIRPAELAVELEQRGFDSLFVPEHTHTPVRRTTPYPAGGPLPNEYNRTIDPFVALTSAAGATTTLKVGTGIALVAQRDPIHFAKLVSSVDLLSNGRFICGVGFGWNIEELGSHGVARSDRWEVVRERMLIAKQLWTKDEASFYGTHGQLEPSWQWPKPVQHPHPPIMIGGGGGPKLIDQVIEYADGWMPIGGSGLRTKIPAVRQLAEDRGRDPATLDFAPFAVKPDIAYFEHLAEIGVSRAVLLLQPGTRDEVLAELDSLTPIVEAFPAT